MATRFVSIDHDTPLLLPPNLRDWVPAGHLVHFVLDTVEALDLRQVKVNTRGTGSEQYPPRLLLGLLIYSYATGVFGSRRIEQSTYDSVPVRLLTADTHPDHDTLCTFRRENEALLTESFVQVLQLAQALNLLKVGQLTVAADGTKVLACFECTSFAPGSPVTVTAFVDGQLIDLDSGSPVNTRIFNWSASNQNHIGLSARASGYVAMDNLAIRVLPLSGGAATDYALGFGLSGTNSAPDRDPDGDGDDNFTEWLRAGDPTSADAGIRLLSIAPAPADEFRLNSFEVLNADTLGLDYAFLFTTNLASNPQTWTNFTPEPVSSTPVGTTHELKLVRVPRSLAATNPQLFIQLRVQ